MTINGYNPCSNSFLRLNSWYFASILGLADMSGTWDLRPHVNWPLHLPLLKGLWNYS